MEGNRLTLKKCFQIAKATELSREKIKTVIAIGADKIKTPRSRTETD